MTKEEIIEKAKVIVFPNEKEEIDLLDIKNEILFLPKDAPQYEGYKDNDHHFTTEYHYEKVIPAISKFLNFSFDINDWIKVPNIIEKNDKKFDLSYLKPKVDKCFTAFDLVNSKSYECGFEGLMMNDNVKDLTWRTEYHNLYAFPHWCSRVINNSENNNRILLVIGDSQSVPDIPIYAYYFKEVWYIDNRYNVPIYDKFMKDVYFDDVVIMCWAERNIDFYTKYIM